MSGPQELSDAERLEQLLAQSEEFGLDPDVYDPEFTGTPERIPLEDNSILQQVNAWATTFIVWAVAFVEQNVIRIPARFTNFLEARATFWKTAVEEEKNRRTEAGTTINAEIQEEIDELDKYSPLVKVSLILWLGFVLWWNRTKVWLQGLSALQARKVSADLRPALISHNELIRYMFMFPSQKDKADKYLADLGLSEELQTMAGDAMRQVPQYAQILLLRNRDLITDKEALEMFAQQAVGPVDAQLLLETRFFYPGPSDIATLTGREAFEQEVIERFDLLAEFDRIPQEVYEKAGMTKETMEWYWVAHWTNPGVVQVFNMLHRLRPEKGGETFTEADMDVYFELADITPYFRDKLKAISYNPLTRVDVRRMYDVDVLDRAGVKSAYQDLGYDDTNAELMTDFTVKWVDRREKDLTRVQVEKLFEIGIIEFPEFEQLLEAMGYDDDEAYYIASLKRATMDADRVDALIDRAEWEYKRKAIDAAQVNTLLAKEDIKASRIVGYLEQWDNERVVEQTLPTKTDIFKWYDNKIIEVEEVIRLMRLREYTDGNIRLYLRDAGWNERQVETVFDEQPSASQARPADFDLRKLGQNGT